MLENRRQMRKEILFSLLSYGVQLAAALADLLLPIDKQ